MQKNPKYILNNIILRVVLPRDAAATIVSNAFSGAMHGRTAVAPLNQTDRKRVRNGSNKTKYFIALLQSPTSR